MKEAFAVKNSLITLLSESARGRFTVTGLSDRKTDSGALLETPRVTVEYESGRFPEHLSSVNGPYQHEASVNVVIQAAAMSEMDLTPLKNGGTPEEVLAAFSGREDAYAKVDKIIDETAALVFDIIMRPMNRNLGMDYDAGRWISDFRKGQPSDLGDTVVRAGVFTLTCQVPEYTTEEAGVPGDALYHNIGLSPDTKGSFAEGEGVNVKAP
jgi:hypothetical protein